MYSKLFLVILLLFSAAKGYADLKTQYCTSTTGTTQIIYELNQTPRQLQTPIILRTQNFEYNGKSVRLAYYEDKGNIWIQETGSVLSTISHTESLNQNLVYVDSRDQYILVKKPIAYNAGTFMYVLFKANLGTGGAMTKWEITTAKINQQQTITDFILRKIFLVSGNDVTFLLSEASKSSIYTFNTVSGQLLFSNAVSTTQSLKKVVGSKWNFYDKSSSAFYTWDGTSYTKKALADFLPTYFPGLSLVITQMKQSLVISQFVQSQAYFLARAGSSSIIDSPSTNKIKEAATIYTDNYINFIGVSTDDLIWSKLNANKQFQEVKLSLASSLDETVKLNILEAFTLAAKVSFDGDTVIILKKTPGTYDEGSIITIKFTPTSSPYFEIIDQYPDCFKAEGNHNSEILDESSAHASYTAEIKCNCLTSSLQTLDCSANALTCTSLTNYERQDCTKGLGVQ